MTAKRNPTPTAMRFNIDGKMYVATISPRTIFLGGEPCYGRIQEHADGGGQILLAPEPFLYHSHRRRTLFHELRHAWRFTRGDVTGMEPDADDAAEMMDVLLRQYADQGGDATLEALEPTPDARVSYLAPVELRNLYHYCGHCNAPLAVGSIENGPPRYHSASGNWSMERQLPCELCDRRTIWLAGCTPDGVPTGLVYGVPPPRVVRAAGSRLAARKFPQSGNLKSLNLRDSVDVARWRALAADLRRPDVELTGEEFAPVLALLHRIRRAGEQVDPMAEALILLIARQATDDDGDNDAHDLPLDLDDGDDEGSPTTFAFAPDCRHVGLEGRAEA